jgi:replicative DNA helicase
MMYSTEAEQSVIGAVLINNELFDELADIVKPLDFSVTVYGEIWATFIELASKSIAIDALTLWQALESSQSEIEKSLIGTLLKNAHTGNSTEYAKIVASLSQSRAISRILTVSQDEIGQNARDPNKVGGDITDKILAVIADQSADFEATSKELGRTWIQQLKDKHQRGDEILGLSTGFPDIDTALCGLQDGHLILLAARPSMGKSTLALNIFNNILRKGKSALFCSMEMSEMECINIMAAQTSGADYGFIQQAKLGEGNTIQGITLFAELLPTYKMTINYSGTQTLATIRSAIRRHRRKFGSIDIVFIDYLQLMKPMGKFQNTNDALGGIAQGLKNLAMELSIPVFVLAQLNRELEKRGDKRPGMADLRGSGEIEQAGNDILFLYADDVYDPKPENENKAELIIGKCRGGRRGYSINLIKEFSKARFLSAHNY